ncbi:MAG: glycosyltransferase family 4 protein [Cytophagales bacterium]
MRIWSYPGIYPFPEGNDHTTGIFIHKQNLALKKIGADIVVVQPWNWAPAWPLSKLFAEWGEMRRNPRPKKRILDGLEVFHPQVFTPRPSRFFGKPYDFYLLNTLERFFNEMGFNPKKDVIHAQWLIPDGHFATLLAKRLGAKCSVEMQGDDIQIWPHNSKQHLDNALWTLENSDLVLGCSDFLCNEAQKLFNKRLETHTIYTGIDLEKFKPCAESDKSEIRKKLGLKDEDFLILNVGSSIARKGWLELFQAVGMLKQKHPNLKILAASGGLSEFKLYEKAREFGILENLIDLGQVPNQELSKLYHACDIFCLPSYWEGLANVLCEAMASGCAVVTTAVSGHPEVVVSGYSGELVQAKSVESLTSALEKLIENPMLRNELGKNARKMAETKIMSHEDNAKKLLSLFEKLF